MKKVFYLNTWDTCRKILAYNLTFTGWELQVKLKKEPITKEESWKCIRKTKSYEALFSKKNPPQIKLRGLDKVFDREKDFKELLLDHYTFS